MTDQQKKDDGKKLLWQYLGLATQLLVSLGIGIFIGIWVDKKIGAPVAVFTWVLPLLILVSILIKVIRDTSRKK